MAKNPFAHYARRTQRPGISPEQLIQMMEAGADKHSQILASAQPNMAKLQENLKDLKGHEGLTREIQQKAEKLQKKLADGLEKDMYYALTPEGAAIGKDLVSLYDASKYNNHQERYKRNSKDREDAKEKMEDWAVQDNAVSYFDEKDGKIKQVDLAKLEKLPKEKQLEVMQNVLTNADEYDYHDQMYSSESTWDSNYASKGSIEDVQEKVDKLLNGVSKGTTLADKAETVMAMIPGLDKNTAQLLAQQGIMPETNLTQLKQAATGLLDGGFLSQREQDAVSAYYGKKLLNERGVLPTASAIRQAFAEDLASKMQTQISTKYNEDTPTAGTGQGSGTEMDQKTKLDSTVYALSGIGDSQVVESQFGNLKLSTVGIPHPKSNPYGHDKKRRTAAQNNELFSSGYWDQAMTMDGTPVGKDLSGRFFYDKATVTVLPVDDTGKPLLDLSKHSLFQSQDMKDALEEAKSPYETVHKPARKKIELALKQLASAGKAKSFLHVSGTLPTAESSTWVTSDYDDKLIEKWKDADGNLPPSVEGPDLSPITSSLGDDAGDFDNYRQVQMLVPATSALQAHMNLTNGTNVNDPLIGSYYKGNDPIQGYEDGGKLPQQGGTPLDQQEKLPNFGSAPQGHGIKFLSMAELLKGRR